MYTMEELHQVIADEESIRFDSFDNQNAIELCQVLFDTAKEQEQNICCQIKLGDFAAVRVFGNGTDGSNIPFLNRKTNSVYKSGKSSMRCMLEAELQNKKEAWQEDSENYVIKGGAFPILRKDGTVLGAICVSGLFHADDHRLAVEALKRYKAQSEKQPAR